MALQTERPHVRQVAFATALHDGNYVVSVPQMPPPAPILFELPARCPIELALVAPQHLRIDPARGANSAIAGEDLLAKIAGVGA
jgi:hypothetical protein